MNRKVGQQPLSVLGLSCFTTLRGFVDRAQIAEVRLSAMNEQGVSTPRRHWFRDEGVAVLVATRDPNVALACDLMV